ncbi:MAG: FG-GAP-like repeat-containing protein, partial [candidate division Zixibacteria bacterium]
GYGTPQDFYRLGNNTMLTPFTRPSTESNLGADSHISMTDFSVSDTLMNFDLDIDWALPGWPQMSHPQINSSPIAVDIDNDDSLEVITIADNRLLIHRYNGEKFIANSDSLGLYGFDNSVIFYPWAVAAVCDTMIIGRPVPVDFDGDGLFEIAVTTASGALYAFTQSDINVDGRVDSVPGYPIQVSANPLVSISAVSFDTLGGMELFVTEDNGDFRIIDGTGTDIYYGNLAGSVLSTANFVAGDFYVIDVALISDNYLVVSRILPNVIETDPAAGNSFYTRLGLPDSCHIITGDIDRDGGMPEIVAVTSNSIIVIEPDGTIGWRMNLGTSLGSPALGDIDADGYPEIVVAGDSKIYAVNHTGTLMTDFPVDLAFLDLEGVLGAEPVIGDVDDDGKPDIVVGFPRGGTYALNYRAEFISGFPLPSSFDIERAGALADLDSDGDLDLLTVEGSGAINAWDVSSQYTSQNAPWAFAGGDIFNSRYLSPSLEKPIIENDLQLPEGSVYNYPNPASNSTTIRFYLSRDSDVTIDVFDFMGERIESVNMRGAAHTDNEYIWDCSDTASGIYFCRVEADDGIGKEMRMIKIALVK